MFARPVTGLARDHDNGFFGGGFFFGVGNLKIANHNGGDKNKFY
jgi:hypothetical protein